MVSYGTSATHLRNVASHKNDVHLLNPGVADDVQGWTQLGLVLLCLL